MFIRQAVLLLLQTQQSLNGGLQRPSGLFEKLIRILRIVQRQRTLHTAQQRGYGQVVLRHGRKFIAVLMTGIAGRQIHKRRVDPVCTCQIGCGGYGPGNAWGDRIICHHQAFRLECLERIAGKTVRHRGGKLMLERHSRIRRLSLGGQQGVRQTVAVHYNRFRGRHPLVIGNSYTVMQKHFQRQCAELDLIPLAQADERIGRGRGQINHQSRRQAPQAIGSVVPDNGTGTRSNASRPVLYLPVTFRRMANITAVFAEQAFCGASAFQFVAIHHL